jgi:diacylglycerol kinase (ATP)
MKAAVIINPKSASGNTVKMWREIQASIQRSLGTIEVLMTEYPHHATSIAKDIATKKDLDCLIIMGGDGSIHEVVNGLMDEKGNVINPKLKVGILNSGRGCDFIRTLGIPVIAGEAVSKLVDGHTKAVDVGQIKIHRHGNTETHYFINSFSYGLGGEVAKNIQRNESMFSPTTTYFLASTMGFLKSRPFEIEFSINGEKPYVSECMNIFVMNGRYSGGGMHWAPPGRLDDGLLDLIVVEKISKLKLAMVTPKVYDGTFLSVKEVKHNQVKSVRMKAKIDLALEMDGEVTQGKDIEISVIPKAIQFIC